MDKRVGVYICSVFIYLGKIPKEKRNKEINQISKVILTMYVTLDSFQD